MVHLHQYLLALFQEATGMIKLNSRYIEKRERLINREKGTTIQIVVPFLYAVRCHMIRLTG